MPLISRYMGSVVFTNATKTIAGNGAAALVMAPTKGKRGRRCAETCLRSELGSSAQRNLPRPRIPPLRKPRAGAILHKGNIVLV